MIACEKVGAKVGESRKVESRLKVVRKSKVVIDQLLSKDVKIHILNMGLIENSPMGRLIVTNLLAFAEFERAMILERTSAGKAVARTKEGYHEGRPKLNVDLEKFRKLQKDGKSVKEICAAMGISRSSYYNLLKISPVS